MADREDQMAKEREKFRQRALRAKREKYEREDLEWNCKRLNISEEELIAIIDEAKQHLYEVQGILQTLATAVGHNPFAVGIVMGRMVTEMRASCDHNIKLLENRKAECYVAFSDDYDIEKDPFCNMEFREDKRRLIDDLVTAYRSGEYPDPLMKGEDIVDPWLPYYLYMGRPWFFRYDK